MGNSDHGTTYTYTASTARAIVHSRNTLDASSFSLSSLELSYTKVYEPQIRVRLGITEVGSPTP